VRPRAVGASVKIELAGIEGRAGSEWARTGFGLRSRYIGLLALSRLAAGSIQRRPISAALEQDRRSCGRADRTPAPFLLTGMAARGSSLGLGGCPA